MICYVLNFLVLSNFLLIDITFWINGMQGVVVLFSFSTYLVMCEMDSFYV
jgi:hypothetical protein